MKIATWNVNSLHARKERVIAFLEREKPDVLCIQELKCSDEKFPDTLFQDMGYHAAWHGQKAYNGVATLSRFPISFVEKGPEEFDPTFGSRVLITEIEDLRIINIYAINGQEVGSEAFQKKKAWFEQLKDYLLRCEASHTPTVLCGDFNVAPEELDVYDGMDRVKRLLVSPEERTWFRSITELGFTDGFRWLHPEEKSFSWWDYRELSFQKNRGLRIDFVLVSPPLQESLQTARMDREERKGEKPSDHVPVVVELDFHPQA